MDFFFHSGAPGLHPYSWIEELVFALRPSAQMYAGFPVGLRKRASVRLEAPLHGVGTVPFHISTPPSHLGSAQISTVTIAGIRGHWGIQTHTVIKVACLSTPLASLPPAAWLGVRTPVAGLLEYSQT